MRIFDDINQKFLEDTLLQNSFIKDVETIKDENGISTFFSIDYNKLGMRDDEESNMVLYMDDGGLKFEATLRLPVVYGDEALKSQKTMKNLSNLCSYEYQWHILVFADEGQYITAYPDIINDDTMSHPHITIKDEDINSVGQVYDIIEEMVNILKKYQNEMLSSDESDINISGDELL